MVEAADIYRVYFHGPAYQVIRRAWCTAEHAISEMSASLGANHHPAAKPLAAAPRLIELCFQTAGLWEMSVQHRMGLPRQVERIRFSSAPDREMGRLFAAVTPASGDSFDAEIVDEAGNRYLEVTGYRTVIFQDHIDHAPLKGLEAVTA